MTQSARASSLLEQTVQLPVCLLVASREEFSQPLQNSKTVSQCGLERLRQRLLLKTEKWRHFREDQCSWKIFILTNTSP